MAVFVHPIPPYWVGLLSLVRPEESSVDHSVQTSRLQPALHDPLPEVENHSAASAIVRPSAPVSGSVLTICEMRIGVAQRVSS